MEEQITFLQFMQEKREEQHLHTDKAFTEALDNLIHNIGHLPEEAQFRVFNYAKIGDSWVFEPVFQTATEWHRLVQQAGHEVLLQQLDKLAEEFVVALRNTAR